MLVPECVASMIGVPVPSIRICERVASGEATGAAWAKTRGAEVDATIRTTVLKTKVRHR
jgi:hypothetical protein